MRSQIAGPAAVRRRRWHIRLKLPFLVLFAADQAQCFASLGAIRTTHAHGITLEFEYSGEQARDKLCRRWNCRCFSARIRRKDKDLAGINTIWISDLVSVRFVNDCVSHARAVGETADAPEAVATRNDRGRDLGHDHGGR